MIKTNVNYLILVTGKTYDSTTMCTCVTIAFTLMTLFIPETA